MGRLLLDAQAVALAVELCHAIALRIIDIIAKDRGETISFRILYALLQQTTEARTIEDIITQYQTGAVVANELLTDDEGLSQSVGRGLLGIFKTDTQVGAITQKTLEARQVVRGGDDEDLTDSRQHKG